MRRAETTSWGAGSGSGLRLLAVLLLLAPSPSSAAQTAAHQAPVQGAVPCAIRVAVVDDGGTALDAQVEAVGTAVSITRLPGNAHCIVVSTASAVSLLVTATGHQPYVTDPQQLEPGADRQLLVTLTRLFAESVTVEGRATSLVGISASASEGAVGQAELAARPLIKAGDILEVVPGVATTQHSSGGHAPIFLLRGYNLDHGTDFASFVEGVPMNLSSHAHGQGYTDFNFVIPELVSRVDFQKGPYAARVGNFGTAGSSNIELVDSVPVPFARVEGGGNGYRRLVGATSVTRGSRRFLVGAEASHDDGPNVVPDDFGRLKATARYSSGTPSNGHSLTFSAYRAAWTATDGFPRRAAERGYIPRFGTLDPSDGGRSQQHVLIAAHHSTTPRTITNLTGYARYYDMDLFSNLTFWTISPTAGDQIHQADRRISSGGHASRAWMLDTGAGRLEFAAGTQVRHDAGRVGLQNTVRREPRSKVTADGRLLPAQVYDTAIDESSLGVYAESRLHPTKWLRVVAGLRGDLIRMSVESDRSLNSGRQVAGITTPKLSVAFGPWRHAELYANVGRGFHSNHAAGVMQRVDPTTGQPERADGALVVPAPAIVPTRGAELGLRLQPARVAQTSLALWYIGSESELLYTPEDGATSPERPGRRVGLEWLNYVQLRRWLTVDLDAAWSSARYRIDPLNEGRAITDTASAVVTGGVTLLQPRFTASLRGRYIGRRPLLPDGSVFQEGSLVLNGQAEIQISRRLRLMLMGFNLLNRPYEDTAYFFETRLRDPRPGGTLEPASVADYVTRPGQPRVLRVGVRVGL